MKIEILSWSYYNIRRMDSVEVKLEKSDGAVPHITLVMMRNGTGKTTTIKLMRAILNGRATEWEPDDVRRYRPSKEAPASGTFTLRVRFDGQIYEYTLRLDYETGTASYQTCATGLYGGLEDGRKLPMEIQGAFDNDQFVNRFIFDGEQARMTLKEGNEEAENAIIHLYQINELDKLKNEIKEIMVKRQEESSNASTEQSVKYNQTRMRKREETLLQLQAREKQLQKEQAELQEQIEPLEKKRIELIASDAELKLEQDRLRDDLNFANEELRNQLRTIGEKIKEPYLVNSLFHEHLQELSGNFRALKLPQSISRNFFEDLAEAKDCVCGRSLCEKDRATIRERAKDYLGEDDLIAINVIKDRIRSYPLPGDENNPLSDAVARMVELKVAIQSIKNALFRLEEKLDDPSSQKLMKLDQRLSEYQKRMKNITREYDQLNAPQGVQGCTEHNNIFLANRAFTDAQRNYRNATGTFEFAARADKLMTYIYDIRREAIAKLKNTIIETANEKIAQILEDDAISIRKIDGHLQLNRGGASEGQTLAIAYAYVGSLFEHSIFEFPFIVDSPAAPMDLGVRREVAHIIPKLFSQLVIFVTSGERKGFAEEFYELGDVMYITIEGQKDTQNAICVYGQETFSAYQEEEVQ